MPHASDRMSSAAQSRRREPLDLTDVEAVAFVCSGNMVRSAFAELYGRHQGLACPHLSLGTTYRNPALHPRTRAELLQAGLAPATLDAFRPTHVEDLSASSRALLTNEGTLVLGMTEAHLEQLDGSCGHARLHLMEELRGRREPIPDPVLDPVSYEQTFSRLRACLEPLLQHFQPADSRVSKGLPR